jgi:hypothetical protein
VSAPRSPLLWRFTEAASGRASEEPRTVELVSGGKALATAYPNGRWTALTLGGFGKADDQAAAKVEALDFVRKALVDAKGGEL